MGCKHQGGRGIRINIVQGAKKGTVRHELALAAWETG